MAMARASNAGKERYWRRVFGQWRRSRLGVRAFCSEHDIAEPSFYAWRRVIQQRDQQAERRSSSGPRPVEGSATGAGRRAGQNGGLPSFIPVTITAPAPALEVVLRDGHLLRVPADFDAATLRRLLTVLAETAPC